ncbi:MAG TPA: ATPase, T2SS/T4P/T4SS family [Candidatus Magasanikbacteria bacterium]|nr:ATPase, T2SS/T4P/T4SS family [Candidatus Magasanikbacteria bacterium]
MLPLEEFKKLLAKKFKLTAAQIATHLEDAQNRGKDLETHLIEKNIIKEDALYDGIAEEYGLTRVSLKGRDIPPETLHELPEAFAEAHHIVAFDSTPTSLKIALTDPTDVQTIEFIRRKSRKDLEVFITTPRETKESLRRYRSNLKQELSQPLAHSDPTDLKKAAEELPIINIVNSILEHSVFENSSDIHIEPTELDVVVRFRIDGILREMMHLPKTVQSGIVARIKILSNLKIDEHMIPQDGRFKISVQGETLSFRVSIIPVYDGEKIVMRLLHEGQKPLTLDELGFLPGIKELIDEAIEKPHGMVLVTGPTGSGKTTTLYSILGMLNQPDVNICTIEDPIEYHVTGINQSQINPKAGFTFASGLRSFLRQDPDIIMVGEIRDKETAEIAIHAAMTGHLVLSTLHTNDAPTTIPRLLDMDIPPFLVAFTSNIIIAQRLVRKICPNCKESFKLTAKELKQLHSLIDKSKLASLFKEHGATLTAKEKSLESLTFYRGNGCKKCDASGYKGRVGIYEVMVVDEELQKIINTKANVNDIKAYAIKNGMLTLFQDGLIKAKLGVTTIEEILRATKD